MTTLEATQQLGELQESGLLLDFAREHPQEFARVLSSYDAEVAAQILQLLPVETLVSITAHVSQEIAASIFRLFEIEEIARLLDSASTDDASRIVNRLSASQRSNVLRLMSDPRKKKVLSQFLHFGTNTVGAMADKDFLWFTSSTSVEQARNAIQAVTDRNMVESAIVLNADETVLGLLDYVSLAQANTSDKVGNCVEHTTLVPAEARPHAVVYFDDWHRVNRLPIVDQDLMPIGVLRWSQLAELAESPIEENEQGTFSLFYEILNTMIELGRSLLTLPDRR
ncbi:MAG: hypothetical protein OXG24_12540 [Gammaproteobacteria bacterium]|nr:hypothetical protein [Gammaproteobacteria bacterium]